MKVMGFCLAQLFDLGQQCPRDDHVIILMNISSQISQNIIRYPILSIRIAQLQQTAEIKSKLQCSA